MPLVESIGDGKTTKGPRNIHEITAEFSPGMQELMRRNMTQCLIFLPLQLLVHLLYCNSHGLLFVVIVKTGRAAWQKKLSNDVHCRTMFHGFGFAGSFACQRYDCIDT